MKFPLISLLETNMWAWDPFHISLAFVQGRRCFLRRYGGHHAGRRFNKVSDNYILDLGILKYVGLMPCRLRGNESTTK